MGAYGSGRWPGRHRREVVEACQRVSAGDLPSSIPAGDKVVLPLRDHHRNIVGNIPAECRVLNNGILALTFGMRIDGESLTQTIPLDWTAAGRGGSRLCFRCPFPVRQKFCGKLSRVLFAPPGAQCLGCRECHKLSYSSSQRRTERLARSDKAADNLADQADEFLARVDRGEKIEFGEMLRNLRRMSYAIHDIWESLHQSAD